MLTAASIPAILLDCGNMRTVEYAEYKTQAINGLNAVCAVEIHCNASGENPRANYCETIYYPGSSRGQVLGETIHAVLAKAFSTNHKRECKGARGQSDLFFLADVIAPACIVEPLFISNPADEAWLRQSGAATIGLLVAEGIADFLGVSK